MKWPSFTLCMYATKNIDADSNIHSISGKLRGVQQSLKERLEKRTRSLSKTYPEFRTSQRIKLKLTGDGTNICHNVHLVVIAFTLVDSYVRSPNSPRGNDTIALIKTTEDYDKLSEALKRYS